METFTTYIGISLLCQKSKTSRNTEPAFLHSRHQLHLLSGRCSRSSPLPVITPQWSQVFIVIYHHKWAIVFFFFSESEVFLIWVSSNSGVIEGRPGGFSSKRCLKYQLLYSCSLCAWPPGAWLSGSCGSASHFTEQTKAQRGKVTCPRSCIQLMTEPRWELGSLTAGSTVLVVRSV